MTEEQWLSRRCPIGMVQFIKDWASGRQLRLFSCACARSAEVELIDDRFKQAILTAERYADGEATDEELFAKYKSARRLSTEMIRCNPNNPKNYQWMVAADTCSSCAFDAAQTGALDAGWIKDSEGKWISESDEYAALADLARDIFGNPFRPVELRAEWRTPPVLTLAETMYIDWKFEQMPALAAALEAAGCQDETILQHCHQVQSHARGCWLIDRLLNRE